MAIEGNLAHVGLADICQLLAMGRKTGCLTVSNRPAYGNVYFKKGRVCFASVANRPDRLGSLLLANGLVDEETLLEAVEGQGDPPRRRLGQILVEAGKLDQDDLDRFITLQVEEAVYHLFGWSEGTFRFEPDEVPDETTTPLVSINTEGLLLEGARRVDEWGLIQKKVPNLDLIFSVERLPGDDEDVDLTPNQERVLPFLDGERTVDDLVDASGLVEFDVAKALFGLLQAGFIVQTGSRPKPAPEPEPEAQDDGLAPAYYRTGMLDDAIRELTAAVEANPADDQSRFRLANAFVRLGRYADALGALEQLGPEAAEGAGARRNRALVLEKLRRYDEARAVLAPLVDESPGEVNVRLAMALTDLKAGRATQALAGLRSARDASRESNAPPMLYAIAVLAAALDGDLRAAVQWGEQGLAAHPEDAAILVNLGVVQERRGRLEDAEALFLKAVSVDEPVPQAHKNLGDLAFDRGDFAGARAHYERAVKLAPRLGDDVYGKLGAIAHEEEDDDWARMLWRRALEINPNNAMARAGIETLDSD